MRVVLDTNVVVSSYLIPLSIPSRIMAAWRSDRFELVVSQAVLTEYARVLNYERLRRRHGLSREEISQELAELADAALQVEPSTVPAVIAADPDDDYVLACALAGESDYIVSGDVHLLNVREYEGIRILSPAAFVGLLESE